VAGIGEWGRTMQDDVSDAVAHFAGRGMIDPQRVCIVGASYGGYAALAGGAFTPELYRCVVSINGIADLVEFHDWVRNEQGSSSQVLAYWEMQIGGAAYDKAEAGVRSPRQSAANFTAPVLLVHSRRDEIVPIAQSKKMEDALEKQGKPVEYLELEGDDHYLSLGETRRAALHATVNFVNRHLQP
jgi:dipeptidyl aminopeptidase/acylaminoacyl peptidase